MNTETVFRLLNNAGFHNLGADDVNIYMEDPACVIRSFETFLEYAWTILVFITGIMLAGWAWAMIRGSKNAEINSITNNLKNLVLVLGVIVATPVLVNFVYGGDLVGRGCETIAIPIETIDKLLEQRYAQLEKYDAYNLYENFEIYDSGIQANQTTYAQKPLVSGGTPGKVMDAAHQATDNQIQEQISSVTNQEIINELNNMTPIRAIETGKDVIFVAVDGTEYKHVGGTRSWRNNNPGNIRMSDFSRKMGAIGTAGGFAVFPDEQTGMMAVKRLLGTKNYADKTIAGAISRYAPPSENNTVAYYRSIEKLTGLNVNKKMADLTDQELDSVVNAIRHIEGWKPGTVEKI